MLENRSRTVIARTHEIWSRTYSSFAAINPNPKCSRRNANHKRKGRKETSCFTLPSSFAANTGLRNISEKEQKCQINKQKSKEKELNNRRIIRGIFFLPHTGFSAAPFPLERFGTKERNLRSLINVFANKRGVEWCHPLARKLSYKLFTFQAIQSWPWLWHNIRVAALIRLSRRLGTKVFAGLLLASFNLRKIFLDDVVQA